MGYLGLFSRVTHAHKMGSHTYSRVMVYPVVSSPVGARVGVGGSFDDDTHAISARLTLLLRW